MIRKGSIGAPLAALLAAFGLALGGAAFAQESGGSAGAGEAQTGSGNR